MLTKLYPVTLFLLRLFTGFMFFQHGAQKLFGWFIGGAAPAFTPFWFAGVIELLGGIAIVAGFLTRPVAAVLAADIGIIYVAQYLPGGFPPVVIRDAEVACILFAIAFLLAFIGAGKFSVDAVMKMGPVTTPASLEQNHSGVLLAFRIMVGLLFLQHGLQKLFGMIGSRPESFMTLRWVAGVIEFVGGAAIALGFLTAPIAFLCCGQMAVAYFMNHAPNGFFPLQNLGERAVLFCYIFMFMVTSGPGKYSLDKVLWKKTGRAGVPIAVRN